MRLFFVLDETSFYHPQFLSKFLSATDDTVVGAALVTAVPDKSNLELYLRKHWYYLTVGEMAKLACLKYRAKILDAVSKRKVGRYYSVKSVLQASGIDFFEARMNINRQDYLEQIKLKNPDVIVSSNSLYFGSKILGIPNLCCLNRHSSLLPSYGGLWPVFQAYRSGEAFTGVSIHKMEKDIDAGLVLSQRKVPIHKGQTLDALYETCFEQSSDALLEAIEAIKNRNTPVCDTPGTPSYYSFPTREHWAEFRKRNGRFI